MSTPSRFDDEARGELLCYLVVGELVAMARTGDWLKTGHLVELAHIWMNANGARSDWQEHIAVTRMAADLAPGCPRRFRPHDGKSPGAVIHGWMAS